jgi:site-specific DNA-methyltransferase (adenine-specific)
MDFMKEFPDKFFDLAIVDPPYNVGASDGRFGGQAGKDSKVSGKTNAKNYANYDSTPDDKYFTELFRVSKNQIIWGANYYPQHLYHSGWIVWDKLTTGPLSDCELAFQSLNKLVTKFTSAWSGFNKQDAGSNYKERIHPNQKPVSLYIWQLKTYSKEGNKILDTHLGSGSSRIAAYKLGFDFWGCELDKDYFDAQEKRFAKAIDEPLFQTQPEPEQKKLFK